ncbi:MAG: alpha/beta fold hydrolase [Alphaproteobacteria bacterium]|nr:alpha/beta fold hydrolase [Alphaproteobacteria bacterium]
MTPARIARGYINLPWGQVHYRTAAAATAGPLLLLLHQSPLSARNYDRVLPLLGAFCRPIAVDTPGYGGSDLPEPTWEVADYANLVFAVADRLGESRFHLFGRATGTVFALAAAMTQPERLHSLTLHGLPVYTAAERADRLASFAPPFAPDDEGGHLAWIWRRIKGEYPWIDPRLATHFVADYLATGGDFATAYRAIWRWDLAGKAQDWRAVPTLLIAGTRDRIGFMHERAVRLLPAARTVTLDGATDFVAEQEPERFAAVLRDMIVANR